MFSRHILNEILSNKSSDDRIDGIHNYLEKIRSDLETNKVPVTLLTVTKQLTKPPEEYTDAKNLPHVQVALRLNKNSAKRLKQGDTVSYVICKVCILNILNLFCNISCINEVNN